MTTEQMAEQMAAPPTTLKRADFATDEEYVEARIQERLRQQDPAYMAQRRQVLREEQAKKEREQRQQQAQEYKRILDSVQLPEAKRREITAEAQRRAAADVTSGRASDLTGTVAKYETQLTDAAKRDAAAGQMFNSAVRTAWRGGKA